MKKLKLDFGTPINENQEITAPENIEEVVDEVKDDESESEEAPEKSTEEDVETVEDGFYHN